MRYIKTVYQKELLDTIRDRKTLLVMILLPLILVPIMMILPQFITQKETEKTKEIQYKVVIQGQQNSPELVDFIKKAPNIKVLDVKMPVEGLKKGDVDLIVNIAKDFNQTVLKEKTAGVSLQFDATKPVSDTTRLQVSQMINNFGKGLVTTRLAKRGVDPQILEPVKVEENNVATKEKMGAMILSFLLPLFLTIWAITGGMYTAIDMAAGEKERGTLEPLLMTPPTRQSLVLGKFFAVLSVAMASVVLALAGMVMSSKILVPMMSKQVGETSISLSGQVFSLTLLVLLLLTAFMCALQLAVSTLARNFKQAQNYLSPLYLISMIPAVVIGVMQTFQPPSFFYIVPVLNTMQIMKDIIKGEIVWSHLTMVIVSSLIYIILAIRLAVNMFNKEKVLFRT